MEAISLGSSSLPQIAIVAKAGAVVVESSKQKVYGNCQVINALHPYFQNDGENALAPVAALMAGIFYTSDKPYKQYEKSAIVTLIKQGDHGKVAFGKSYDSTYSEWFYTPEAGFKGKDRVTFVVELGGKTFKVEYFLHVVELGRNRDMKLVQACEKRPYWKISQSDIDSGTQDPATWLRSAQLSALLATASQSFTDLTDLPGTAVGQTVGGGASASITLDTTAAGHGWYVDPTPLDNTDDYLPTSTPNIWQAKSGTDATGKMDMLSVLLHEYGHALGLAHSAQVGDFMSATLQPGERRLP